MGSDERRKNKGIRKWGGDARDTINFGKAKLDWLFASTKGKKRGYEGGC